MRERGQVDRYIGDHDRQGEDDPRAWPYVQKQRAEGVEDRERCPEEVEGERLVGRDEKASFDELDDVHHAPRREPRRENGSSDGGALVRQATERESTDEHERRRLDRSKRGIVHTTDSTTRDQAPSAAIRPRAIPTPMKRAWLPALLLAAFAGCSRKSDPPAPAPSPAAPTVASPRPSSSTTPVAARPASVNTTMTSDDPTDPSATRTYETWLTDGATKHLLARNGISPADETATDSPVTTRLSGNDVHYEFDGQNVPSTWVGTMSADFTVSPLALVRAQTDYVNRVQGCHRELTEWSWTTLTGDVAWWCERGAKCERHEYVPVPDVTLPDGYASEGSDWACRTIDGCSVAIDGTKGHGFVTFGERKAGDPTFLAVVSGRWLFVQLEGDLSGSVGDGRARRVRCARDRAPHRAAGEARRPHGRLQRGVGPEAAQRDRDEPPRLRRHDVARAREARRSEATHMPSREGRAGAGRGACRERRADRDVRVTHAGAFAQRPHLTDRISAPARSART